MIDINQIKKQILTSKLKSSEKDEILNLLTKFGSSFTEFVYRESSKMYFELLAPSLIEAMKNLLQAQEDIKNGNPGSAVKIINIAPDEGFYGAGEFVLPWAIDIKKTLDVRNLQNRELYLTISEFETEMFSLLNKNDIADLVRYSLVYLLGKKIDFLALLKKAAYLKHWQNDPAELKIVQDAILQNTETISNSTITIGDKQVPMTLGNIVKDFITFSPYSATGRTAYDISKYFISGKALTSLNVENKEILLDSLKIFLWLQKPIITEREEDELINFVYRRPGLEYVSEGQNEQLNIDGIKKNQQNSEENQPDGVLLKAPPVNRKTNQIDINKKLEDLRKKVNN